MKQPLYMFLAICLPLLSVGLAVFASEESPESYAVSDNYVLQPRDSVTVLVFGESELSTTQMIDSDGRIIMPLVGEIRLKGLTPRQAERHIGERFKQEQILVNPHITLRLAGFAERQFYIFGEVRSPGVKNFPLDATSLDILQALTMAGSFTEMARPQRVRVTRTGRDGTEENIIVNVERLMRGEGESSEDNIRIFPDDRIFVPQRIW